eukprot:3460756-Rhodomonas_salina.2
MVLGAVRYCASVGCYAHRTRPLASATPNASPASARGASACEIKAESLKLSTSSTGNAVDLARARSTALSAKAFDSADAPARRGGRERRRGERERGRRKPE